MKFLKKKKGIFGKIDMICFSELQKIFIKSFPNDKI